MRIAKTILSKYHCCTDVDLHKQKNNFYAVAFYTTLLCSEFKEPLLEYELVLTRRCDDFTSK